MAHLMSSAQIETDFSAASMVLPSNRGSMDARYFQVQLCAFVNFLHLVHPEDVSPKSMSAKEVSEALPAHGFGVADLYPERVYDDSHDEGYDSSWDLHTVCSTFKQSLLSVLMSKSRQIKL